MMAMPAQPKWPTVAFLLIAAVWTAAATPAAASKGDCGQPSSSGSSPVASDALGVLKAAVGTIECAVCVCDVTRDGKIVSADALRVLRFAVGSVQDLDCLTCRNEVTLGPGGGVLASKGGRVIVDVPSGALAGSTLLGIEEVPAEDLPEFLNPEGTSTAWRITPVGLELLDTATVAVRVDDSILAEANVLGARLTQLTSTDDSGTKFLGDHGLEFSRSTGEATVHAHLDRLGLLAVVPLQVTARINNVPNDGTTAPTFTEAAQVLQLLTEAIVDVTEASYTDNNFGAWSPADGNTIDIAIEEISDGFFSTPFDYKCASAADTAYTPTMRATYDIVAAVDNPPQDLTYTILPRTDISCVP